MAKKKDEAKEITLSNSKLINAIEKIKQFDSFHFAPLVLLKLVRAGIEVRNKGEAALKARDELVKQHFPEERRVNSKHANFNKYLEEVSVVLDQEVSVTIPVIKQDEINLEENNIPVSLLMDFDWLIDLG